MKDNDIRQIWETANKRTTNLYSLEEIKAYQKKQARDISHLIKRGIGVDIGFKIVNLLALVVLFFKVSNAFNTQVAIGFVSLILIVSVLLEFGIVLESDKLERSKSIIENLQDELRFMQSAYRPFLFLGPLSNAFFFLAGSFWYYYLKYGAIPSLDFIDILVLGSLLLIGYATGYFANLPFYKTQIKDLKACIHDLDDQYLASNVIIRQTNRRRRRHILVFILLLLGVLLLSLLIWFYLK